MDGIILVNKPSGMTSHDLVQKVRRILHESKIGHTGTLDPLANGLMILTIGKSTKILPFMSHYFKEYICTMKMGQRSDTLDCTGEILEERDIKAFNKLEAIEALNSLLGPSLQTPPMYSAKKFNGRHLYDLARENIEVERKAVPIEIKEIELLDLSENTITFRVLCSTGTYVRVLTQDIADRLGNIAVMTALQRTKIDKFDLNEAYNLEDLDENVKTFNNYEVLNDHFYYEYDDVKTIINGKKIKIDCDEPMVMITHENEVLAAYQKADDGWYYSKRGLW